MITNRFELENSSGLLNIYLVIVDIVCTCDKIGTHQYMMLTTMHRHGCTCW